MWSISPPLSILLVMTWNDTMLMWRVEVRWETEVASDDVAFGYYLSSADKSEGGSFALDHGWLQVTETWDHREWDCGLGGTTMGLKKSRAFYVTQSRDHISRPHSLNSRAEAQRDERHRVGQVTAQVRKNHLMRELYFLLELRQCSPAHADAHWPETSLRISSQGAALGEH